MPGISTGVGLVSGLNYKQLVDTIITAQRGGAKRMEDRISGYQSVEKGLSSLEATVLSISTSVQSLGNKSTFNSFQAQNSDENQLSVKTTDAVQPGTYSFQALRKAANHQVLSKGFANTDTETLGAGTITIATGGRLNSETLLDSLNSGVGVHRGEIQIADRSGQTAAVDLSTAYTVQDVLDAINNTANLDVTASVSGGHLVLTDTSGATANDLSVLDVGGGSTASDLGIAQSQSASTITGSDVFTIDGGLSLSEINDGNGLDRANGAPDIRITLTDDSTLEINLDGAATINDVVNLINNDENNGGRVSASLSNGRLVLEDLTGGGGTSAFHVEDINTASVVRQLGLDATASGTTLTGNRLAAGLNSVLLRNLNGGAGITQTGQISLTDRSGATATIDLTGAESLDEVISAINSSGLSLVAKVNDQGTGLNIQDSSGASASNLIVSDVGGGTTAADLNIAVDAAVDSVDSGSLNLRYVNEASSLNNYAPNGSAISQGSFLIRDSAGNEATITIGSSVTNVGDVIDRINGATGINVTAKLNETGDGFELVDEAGGAGTLKVEEIGGDVASDLRLLGDSYVGSDGKQHITSRKTAVIDVAADDTLDDVISKLNEYSGTVSVSVFNDGTSLNSNHLLLNSTTGGAKGRLIIDTGGLDLGLNVVTQGQDALLNVNSFGSVSFLRSSSTNTFTDAAPGLDVTVKQPGATSAEINVSQDTSAIESALKSFVSGYNSYASTTADLTKYDPSANQVGVLQGSSIPLRVSQRLQDLVTKQITAGDGSITTLSQLGITFDKGGKLTFNTDVFHSAFAANPQEVADFFQTKGTGFADVAKATLDSLTNNSTGTFAVEKKSLDDTITSLTDRVNEIDAILEIRRQRLTQEFVNMETILGKLSSQQNALGSIAPLSVQRHRSSRHPHLRLRRPNRAAANWIRWANVIHQLTGMSTDLSSYNFWKRTSRHGWPRFLSGNASAHGFALPLAFNGVGWSDPIRLPSGGGPFGEGC